MEPWQTPTLLNGWVNYGSGYNPAGYFKDSSGVVHLRGLVKSGGFDVFGGIFTLPIGYRPPGRGIFAVLTNSELGGVDVLSNGEVLPRIGNNAWISLEGITFRVAP